MTEKPIIFSGPMIRAILDGRKTMTRRVVKCREQIECLGTCQDWNAGKIDERMPDWETWGPQSGAQVFVGKHGNIFSLKCPYGGPGDRLWVKETFMGTKDCLSYRATDPRQVIEFGFDKWKPSIFMPRWASRITLEIVSVRVERLNDIMECDAIAEGVNKPEAYGCRYRDSFAALWESIHGPGSWEQNPWVWVIEFGRVP